MHYMHLTRSKSNMHFFICNYMDEIWIVIEQEICKNAANAANMQQICNTCTLSKSFINYAVYMQLYV
jgi:hypothetical protein